MGTVIKNAAIAAISLTVNQISLFQLSSSNSLMLNSWSGSSWGGWSSLGGTFNYVPAVSKYGSNSYHVVGTGSDNGA